MEMPKPSAGHKRFELLAGEWEGEETMYPSQWDPEGGEAKGRSNSRIGVGGFALITDYEQERNGLITFTGHGIYTFNPNKELYSLYWIDSIGSPLEVFTGGFTDNVLVLSHGGPPFHVRLTWDLREPDLMVSQMEMSRDGRIWNKLFDAQYHRL